jgi:hypothetical protein
MIFDVASRRLAALVCTAVSLSFASSDGAAAAPLAAELGPVLPQAEVSGGYVGRLKVMPEHGPVGTPVTVTGEGLPPGREFQLAWSTVNGSWKVTTSEYFGREFTPPSYRIDGAERRGRPHRGISAAVSPWQRAPPPAASPAARCHRHTVA